MMTFKILRFDAKPTTGIFDHPAFLDPSVSRRKSKPALFSALTPAVTRPQVLVSTNLGTYCRDLLVEWLIRYEPNSKFDNLGSHHTASPDHFFPGVSGRNVVSF